MMNREDLKSFLEKHLHQYAKLGYEKLSSIQDTLQESVDVPPEGYGISAYLLDKSDNPDDPWIHIVVALDLSNNRYFSHSVSGSIFMKPSGEYTLKRAIGS
jgi:hypothetical protein